MKALWKTKMQVKGRPIYVPFNQVNISTGNGYWADCKARFWQSERHAKGVADVAYCIKMFLTQPFHIKNWFLLWFIIVHHQFAQLLTFLKQYHLVSYQICVIAQIQVFLPNSTVSYLQH